MPKRTPPTAVAGGDFFCLWELRAGSLGSSYRSSRRDNSRSARHGLLQIVDRLFDEALDLTGRERDPVARAAHQRTRIEAAANFVAPGWPCQGLLCRTRLPGHASVGDDRLEVGWQLGDSLLVEDAYGTDQRREDDREDSQEGIRVQTLAYYFRESIIDRSQDRMQVRDNSRVGRSQEKEWAGEEE